MKITISGLDRVKEMVDKYANLKERCLEIAIRLCAIGEPIIKAAHGGHAVVFTEEKENGYSIVAEGEDILFVEFGAGDAAGIMAGYYDQVPASVRPGSWSETHAQMYSKYGFWVFAGKIMHEVEPNPSFYYAYEAMVEALPKIAQEVFAT